MTRISTLTVVTILLAVTAPSQAQFSIGLRPPAPAPMLAGVPPAPAVPIPGQGFGRTNPSAPATSPYLRLNPLGFYSGYFPIYPSWDEPENPRTVINNIYYNNIAPMPQAVAIPRIPPPVITKARLILKVPRDAEVTVSGKKMDAASGSVIVESPDLKPGERHLFDVKVTWKEGEKTEERTRQIRLEAGDEKSLSYYGGK